MRRFYLVADGTRIGLNGENGLFLTDPSGLGATYETTFSSIGSGHFTASKVRQKQGQYAASLNIRHGDVYGKYTEFADALFSAEKLRLIYAPGDTEYTADVAVRTVGKGEMSGPFLTSTLLFDLLTPWYTEETLTGQGSVNIPSGGQTGYAVLLTTTGTALTDPVITLRETGGTVISRVEISESFLAGDRIEYSTRYDDSHITGTVGGTETDLIRACDITKPVYGHTRNAAVLTVTDADSASPAITVTVRRYRRTV